MNYFVSIREKGRVRVISFHAETLAAAIKIMRALGAKTMVVAQ